jgi:drug/metabolite transporter (DMT)-like permease
MNKRTLGFIFLFLNTIFWAAESIVSKIALDKGYDPEIFTYQSLIGGAIVFFAYILFFKRDALNFKKSKNFFSSKNLLLMILVGVIGSGLATLTTYYGLKLSSAINFGFLIKLAMVFNVFLAYFFLREKITHKKLFYMILILIGAYFLSTNGDMLVPQIGDLFIIGSALCYAVATAISKPLLDKNQSPEMLGFFRTLFGGLAFFLFVLLIKQNVFASPFPLLLGLRIITEFLTTLTMYLALKETTISYFTIVSSFFPVLMIITGILIFHEQLTVIKVFSGSLMLIAVYLAHKDKDV